jgi:hypothetical protein
MTTFQRATAVAAGVVVLVLIVIGEGALALPIFAVFMLVAFPSGWWHDHRSKAR